MCSEDDDTLVENNEENLIQKRTITINEYVINFDEEIQPPSLYRKIFQLLREATEQDKIILLLNTDGGSVNTFVQLYGHILECKAKVIAKVYYAYSAGAMIAFLCDEIIPQEASSMLIHTISWESAGKIPEITSKAGFMKRWNSEFYKLFNGFLTRTEIENVIDGTDLWFVKSEIEKRLENWIPIKQRNNEKK